VLKVFRSVLIHQLHVANIGGLAVKCVVTKGGPGQHLTNLPEFAECKAQATFFQAMLQAPQTARFTSSRF
jgi:hypothetical protein